MQILESILEPVKDEFPQFIVEYHRYYDFNMESVQFVACVNKSPTVVSGVNLTKELIVEVCGYCLSSSEGRFIVDVHDYWCVKTTTFDLADPQSIDNIEELVKKTLSNYIKVSYGFWD